MTKDRKQRPNAKDGKPSTYASERLRRKRRTRRKGDTTLNVTIHLTRELRRPAEDTQ